MKKAQLNEDICLGCGLCVKACDKDQITLKLRDKRVITPNNGRSKSHNNGHRKRETPKFDF